MTRSIGSLLCLIGALAATCLFFGPGFRASLSNDGSVAREITTHYMGLPTSPWWDYKTIIVDDKLVESDLNVHLGSVSWLFLFAAVLLFIAWHKLSRASGGGRETAN